MPARKLIPTILFVALVGIAGFFVSFKWETPKMTSDTAQSLKQTNLKSETDNYNISEQARAFILPVSRISYFPVRDFNIAEPQIQAKSIALYDTRSSRFLLVKNASEKLPIASITKLMSAIVILENLDLNEIFTVRAEDINVDGNGADLYRGEKIKGEDLFKIMLIKSSNDAALTFANAARIKGIDFVAKMNDKAAELGMFNTHFEDPAGLDDKSGFSTAEDLIRLVSYIPKDSKIWQVLKIQTADVVSADGKLSHHVINTNQLLGVLPDIIGGKTGFTDSAMGTMVLEVWVNKGRDAIIGVVIGSNDRFGDMKNLIEWAQKAHRWE
jgi:serine-type D-Ala-D-Ala carboxypeptidase (penicillin-binding protein 5/6)